MVAHAGVSHAAVVVMVHWGKTASCLLAGGSLGYLLADPSSSLVSLPLAGIGSAVFLLFQYPTAKDRTESQLREEIAQGESRFGALAQAAGAVVWRSSAAGEIDTPQPQWCEFTGQSFEESAGHSWMDAIHPGDRERVSRQWPVAVAKHAVYQAELRLRDKRGGYRDVVLRAAPVMGDGGRVQEWVGALVDVTEERTEQRALAEQERHHRRVLDALETFVTVLSPRATW